MIVTVIYAVGINLDLIRYCCILLKIEYVVFGKK